MINYTPEYHQEYLWLTATLLLTAIIWIPYIINRLKEEGPIKALLNPQPDKRPKAQWAERLMCAHTNAVENLVIFAPLVILVGINQLFSETTLLACQIYFFARIAHLVIYTIGIPLLRTIAFFTGFMAQAYLAWVLLLNI